MGIVIIFDLLHILGGAAMNGIKNACFGYFLLWLKVKP